MSRPSEPICRRLARALATKFGRRLDQLLGGRTRPLAEAVLRLLMQDGAQEVRQALAEAVAASASLPLAVAVRVAGDEPKVARPILGQSPVQGDDHLCAIVRGRAVARDAPADRGGLARRPPDPRSPGPGAEGVVDPRLATARCRYNKARESTRSRPPA
jgi:uncharacterized protein (DUF2336 family)